MKNTWEVIKQGVGSAWNKILDTGGIISKSIKDVTNFSKKVFKGLIKDGTSIIVDGIKSLKIDLTSFAVGGWTWYTGRKKRKKIELFQKQLGVDKKKAEEIVGQAKTALLFAHIAYQKNTQEEWEMKKQIFNKGFRKIGEEQLAVMGIDSSYLRDDVSGFKVIAYINDQTKEIVFAFAGTEDWKDWSTNLLQGLGKETKQYKKARKLAEKIRDNVLHNSSNKYYAYNISAYGQSLGGGLPSLFGAITKVKTIVFVAAGLHENTLKRAGVTEREFPNIINIRTGNDALTHFQEKAGNKELKDTIETVNFLDKIGVLKIEDLERIGKDKLSPEAIEALKPYLNKSTNISDIMPDAIGQQVTLKKGMDDYLVNGLAKMVDDIVLHNMTNNTVENGINAWKMKISHGDF